MRTAIVILIILMFFALLNYEITTWEPSPDCSELELIFNTYVPMSGV